MTELESIKTMLAETHKLGRILVANYELNGNEKVQVEQSVRKIISCLYSRLNEISVPFEKMPASIKSDLGM